jgi:hypothetical protein
VTGWLGSLVEELDDRVDVAEAHLVGAGGDARDRFHRTVAGVDGDVQALLGEITAILGQQEAGGRPLRNANRA